MAKLNKKKWSHQFGWSPRVVNKLPFIFLKTLKFNEYKLSYKLKNNLNIFLL